MRDVYRRGGYFVDIAEAPDSQSAAISTSMALAVVILDCNRNDEANAGSANSNSIEARGTHVARHPSALRGLSALHAAHIVESITEADRFLIVDDWASDHLSGMWNI